MFETWIQAVTGPNEDNYLNILKSGDASFGTAAVWMIVAGIISGVLTGLGTFIGSQFGGNQFAELGVGIGIILVIFPIIVIIGFFIGSGIFYLVAKALGGTGDFGEQSYLLAAAQAPLNIASAALTLIPFVGSCLALPVGIYNIYLNILAIKTAHGFDWGKAVATVLIPLVILFVLACGCIFALGLLGAGIGGVFEEIQRELGTP